MDDSGKPKREPRPLDPTTIQLINEKERIDPSLTLVHRILQDEVERRSGRGEPEFLEVDIPRKIKLMKKVLVPLLRNPEFNFIGKLMGPGGSTLKKLQEKLSVKIHVAGRGSSKDIQKEEELLMAGDPKHRHFAEDLHVRVETIAQPAEAFRKIADALEEIKAHFNTDLDDEISRSQVAELGFNPNQASLAKKAANAVGNMDNRRNPRGRNAFNQFGNGPVTPVFNDFSRASGPPMIRPPFNTPPRGPYNDFTQQLPNEMYNMPPAGMGYNEPPFHPPPNLPGPQMMPQGIMPPQRAAYNGPRPPINPTPSYPMGNQNGMGMPSMMNVPPMSGGMGGGNMGAGGKWAPGGQIRGAHRPHPYGRVMQGPGGEGLRNMGPY